MSTYMNYNSLLDEINTKLDKEVLGLLEQLPDDTLFTLTWITDKSQLPLGNFDIRHRLEISYNVGTAKEVYFKHKGYLYQAKKVGVINAKEN